MEDENFDENMTMEKFYAKINTTKKEYVELLKISEKGKVLIMKRECKEIYINDYNPEMLTARDANMDLQNVIDPYAVVSYTASYMNKDETQTTTFLTLFHTAWGGHHPLFYKIFDD